MSAPVVVPSPVAGLCECCQVRPARQLVHLPAVDGALVVAPYSLGELVADFEHDYFRICGAACDLGGREG